ncbi:MAG: hypothetical protein ACRDFR_06100 [Candidatus Limnocylindria bacterium]
MSEAGVKHRTRWISVTAMEEASIAPDLALVSFAVTAHLPKLGIAAGDLSVTRHIRAWFAIK